MSYYEPRLAGHFPYHIQLFPLPSFPAHWHTETEVIYVESGRVTLTVNERRRVMTDRTLSVITCSEIHSIDEVTPGTCVLIIKLGYELLGNRYDDLARCDFRRLPDDFKRLPEGAPPETELRTLISLAERFNHDGGQHNPVLDLRIRASLLTLTALLMDLCGHAQESGSLNRRAESKLAIQRVMNYIAQNFTSPITLDQAVALSGFEKTRFCELFRAETGMSFHEYLNRRRIEVSKTLLASTDKPVCFIAEAVGIPEAKTFTRLFRTYEGVTPTAWKTEQKE